MLMLYNNIYLVKLIEFTVYNTHTHTLYIVEGERGRKGERRRERERERDRWMEGGRDRGERGREGGREGG